ncbi:hypothetical protein RM52_07560 [Microbacterium hominis]|uniref:Uncharacterized protein n=1 Tax=Microbacterium hominis TaxID=162426 RepID=A0A0B4D0S4_9MICO|nr:hypothetical protein RM52_07560 [Microbacterium hominis]
MKMLCIQHSRFVTKQPTFQEEASPVLHRPLENYLGGQIQRDHLYLAASVGGVDQRSGDRGRFHHLTLKT